MINILGISTYFQDLDYAYLKEASKLGVKYLFTSLHIPEEDLSNLDEQLPIFLKAVKEYDLTLVPDISPKTFEKLNLEKNDYEGLKKLGFKALRLDYGFDDFNLIKNLQKDFEIILNASTINKKYLIDARNNGIDLTKISLMHNFYPKTDTGLSLEYFNSINKDFVDLEMKIMAFVPGDKLKRFPLYEGLPTLEKHRQVDPYVASVELIKDCGITDILIGDSIAHMYTLNWIYSYMKDKILHIPVFFKKPYETFYNTDFTVRRDPSDKVIRLGTKRIEGIEVLDNSYRFRGSITMENKLAGRYSGEINIHKEESNMSSRSNIMGFIHPKYIDLINYIDRDTKIRFVNLV